MLLGNDPRQRARGIEQWGDQRLQNLERVAENLVGENERAGVPLAVVGPARRVVCRGVMPAGAVIVRRGIRMRRERSALAITGVRMVRAATHHQVNHQNRGSQDAAQLGHTSLRPRHNRYRKPNRNIFTRNVPPPFRRGPSRISQSIIWPMAVWLQAISPGASAREARSEGSRTAGCLRSRPATHEGRVRLPGTQGWSGNRSAVPSTAPGSRTRPVDNRP
jgi:hypothetical protein